MLIRKDMLSDDGDEENMSSDDHEEEITEPDDPITDGLSWTPVREMKHLQVPQFEGNKLRQWLSGQSTVDLIQLCVEQRWSAQGSHSDLVERLLHALS